MDKYVERNRLNCINSGSALTSNWAMEKTVALSAQRWIRQNTH